MKNNINFMLQDVMAIEQTTHRFFESVQIIQFQRRQPFPFLQPGSDPDIRLIFPGTH